MPHVVVNGSKLAVRFLDVELAKLKLDAENPRLHSAYLTHQLAAKPTQAEIEQTLVSLPEFQDLLDAIARNEVRKETWLQSFYFGDDVLPGLKRLVEENLDEIDAARGVLGFTPRLSIRGIGSWLAATLVVWLVTALATLLLPLLIVRKKASPS